MSVHATLLAAGGGNAKVLWYLTRGSGVVALLLLTASMLLGVLGALRWSAERWPRFAITSIHRNLTLLSIVFVAIHVVTTVADGFAPIGLLDGVVPFASPYRTVWLGLGTVAFDLLLALVVTSLLRARVGARLWRAIHWLAYASWPIALLHTYGTGSDARFGWLRLLGFGCTALVALAALVRVAAGGLPVARLGGAAAALATPIVLFVWYSGGPAKHGWAARAGTPVSILRRVSAASSRTSGASRTLTSAATPPTSFSSTLTGRLTQSQAANGLVTIHLLLRLRGGPGGAARIDLQGVPDGGGVSLTASGVSFVPATTGAVYSGAVTGLQGSDVAATVRDPAGDRLALAFGLHIDASTQRVLGQVTASTGGGDQ